jgi:hypothetical protein
MIMDMNTSNEPGDHMMHMAILSTVFSVFIIIAACLIEGKRGSPSEIYGRRYPVEREEDDGPKGPE